MEKQIVLLDTSVLIDYFRKRDKSKSYFYQLSDFYSDSVVSSITHYEIYIGVKTEEQRKVWDNFFNRVKVIPFDETMSHIAVDINLKLKQTRKQIELADLFIAATAVSQNLPFATLNTKHFSRIDSLNLISKTDEDEL